MRLRLLDASLGIPPALATFVAVLGIVADNESDLIQTYARFEEDKQVRIDPSIMLFAGLAVRRSSAEVGHLAIGRGTLGAIGVDELQSSLSRTLRQLLRFSERAARAPL